VNELLYNSGICSERLQPGRLAAQQRGYTGLNKPPGLWPGIVIAAAAGPGSPDLVVARAGNHVERCGTVRQTSFGSIVISGSGTIR